MGQAKVIRIHATGAPEVLQLDTVELAAPGPGEAQVRNAAVGFNFIDVYQRRGIYPLPLPTGLGFEGAGEVVAVGEGVTQFKVGDKVAYMNAGLGAYADLRNVPADKLVHVPAGVGLEEAAAVFFKGMTAQYLVKRTYQVKPGDLVLVHSAAGGVGQILASWSKALGATVVGTASSDEKCAVAKTAGCDIAINYSHPDWVERLLEATGGRKAEVVYDAVGKDTFLKSLDCAAQFGLVVLYGGASGPAPAIEPELLNKKGCLFLTRPSVFPHNADPATFRANAADLFDAVAKGFVKPAIGARFPLAEAAEAHRTAEARKVTGAILLLP